MRLPEPWQHLYELLTELGQVVPIRAADESYLWIHSADVLARIENGDPSWEQMVPPKVAAIVKSERLFRR